MVKQDEHLEELTSAILLDNDMYKIPVDVVKIANANDINVYTGKLDSKVSGAIRYNETQKKFEILVNERDVRVRQRFTIAHELAHYFLHEEILKNEELHIDTVLYRTDTITTEDEKKREKDADYFAGALLMNKTLLTSLRNNNTITELADIFDVSVSAMTVRLDVLGLL